MHPIIIQYQAEATMRDRLRAAEQARRARPIRTPGVGRRRVAEPASFVRRRRPVEDRAGGGRTGLQRPVVTTQCCPSA